ncbi:2-succinyl-6-hydroxy-2,4-cyclohexadiene-1-carboxylate synthase [Ferrimonas sediminicola]|uniref:Putative 2-succinyl-6-hydroxy-2,4-cyclohexadiene-1-carboxylate synthase n=1 Tax=Ferrimonas sediminicola TaxID=2569538 RepID=A0A4U1BAU8_9GAMM|nr:2-succinyl-6-hydroxy-2,4-cyclohexadiene-1-carboxylate synthase [Ferrimonas sediminicola]TKB47929.1 2-succinyl-6-hydroxy-2,4-cyclohexadiene-1-carboxylate synthase [Ferrimonas sediminicola]
MCPSADRPTLVLLHGFLGSAEDWQPVLPALQRHFHCLALDLPGHGDNRTPLTRGPGFDEVCQQLEARLPRGRFHLLGYSLGGRIALHLAQRNPGHLLSLTLESAHPGLTSQQERQARRQADARWQRLLQHHSLAEFLRQWYRQPVFADLTDQARQRMIDARLGNDPDALGALYHNTGLGWQQDQRAMLAELTVPTHYLCGRADTKFLTLGQELKRQGLVDGLHHFDCGHNVHRACPGPFADTLIQTLIS